MISHERRACARYPGDSELLFSSWLAGEPVVYKARVHDVSAAGFGLYVGPRDWFVPGDELTAALPGEELGRLVGARVAHIRRHDGGWLLGCALGERLSVEDLEWLRQSELVGSR
jgi:hypothetical protein